MNQVNISIDIVSKSQLESSMKTVHLMKNKNVESDPKSNLIASPLW